MDEREDRVTEQPAGEPAEDRGMTVREAGRLGGEARKAQLGLTGYQALGRAGGAATRATHGPEFYAAIGRRGGQKVAAERGPAFFSEIGKRGGARVRALVERAKAEEEGG